MFRRFFILLLVLAAAAAAGWLALRRADIPYDSLEAKYADASSKFLTLDNGVKAHYRDQGAKTSPTILLIHGFASSLHTWEAWAQDLSTDYRVISLDLPGHGLTRLNDETDLSIAGMVEFVESFRRKLGLDHFYLAGSSMGGNTAWNYTVQHTSHVDGLILVSASGLPQTEPNTKAPFVFTLIRNPVTGPLLVDLDISPLIREGIEKSFYDQSFVTDDMVDQYAEFSRAPGHRRALLALATREDPDLSSHVKSLSELKVPTLILVGDHDNLVPPDHARRFNEFISGSKLIEYKNVGHLPQEEIAAQSVSDARAFLVSLQSDDKAAQP